MRGRMDADRSILPAWRLDWLTPVRCRLILGLVLAIGFVSHLLFLTVAPPFGLSGDEAHYWDWSRKLDWSYYSKGPLVALIIRASCAVFGEVMWAVRLPALVLAVLTSLLTYWVVRRLFGSERLALGTVLLTHTGPIFVLGSMLMTIDPPFFFCWALATCLAVKAIFDGRRWAWPLIGIAAGLGLLAKYAMPLWFVGLFAFLVFDQPSRRYLRSPWPYLSFLISMLFLVAPWVWNMNHDWVTFRHVTTQLSNETKSGWSYVLFPLEMLGTQLGVLGPVLGVFVVLGVVEAIRQGNRSTTFLLSIGLSFFAVVLFKSITTKIEPNWPAPAYFTLVPLAAWWLSRRLVSAARWRPVRGFFWFHVGFGLVTMMLIHRTDLTYPLMDAAGVRPRRLDAQIIKMRGNDQLGLEVGRQLQKLGPNAMLIGDHYQVASLMTFYVPGQPRTFCTGPFLKPPEQMRLSQFDFWPDADLTSPEWIGRDAVFVGSLDRAGVIAGAFESIELAQEVPITVRGIEVRRVNVYVARGFRGLTRPESNRH
jgi:hypothetical protein